MLRLFITTYPEQSQQRREEYLKCLHRNLACGAIDEVYVLQEAGGYALPSSSKLRIHDVLVRPTYNDFFNVINDVAAPQDVSIIANTDIWFEPNLRAVVRTLQPGECYALTRWQDGALFYRSDSQDCWIFRGAVHGVDGSYPLGVPRCDNRLLHELRIAGYELRNPALSIKAHHEHSGAREEYGTNEPHYVAPPYSYIWPQNLLGPVSALLHNLRYTAKVGWRLDYARVGHSRMWQALSRVLIGGRLRGGRSRP